MDKKNHTHTHKCKTTEHDLLHVPLDSFEAKKSLLWRIGKSLDYWCIRFHWNLHLTHYRAFQVENLKDLRSTLFKFDASNDILVPILRTSSVVFHHLLEDLSKLNIQHGLYNKGIWQFLFTNALQIVYISSFWYIFFVRDKRQVILFMSQYRNQSWSEVSARKAAPTKHASLIVSPSVL